MQTRYRSEIFNKVLEFFNSFWEFVREEGRPIGSFCKKSIQRVRTQTRDILHKFTSLDIILGGISVSIMFVGGARCFRWIGHSYLSVIPMAPGRGLVGEFPCFRRLIIFSRVPLFMAGWTLRNPGWAFMRW